MTGLLHAINGAKHTVRPNRTAEAAVKNQLPREYMQHTPSSRITLAVNADIVVNILYFGIINGVTRSDAGISIAANTIKNQLSPDPAAISTIKQISTGTRSNSAMINPATALFLLKNLA